MSNVSVQAVVEGAEVEEAADLLGGGGSEEEKGEEGAELFGGGGSGEEKCEAASVEGGVNARADELAAAGVQISPSYKGKQAGGGAQMSPSYGEKRAASVGGGVQAGAGEEVAAGVQMSPSYGGKQAGGGAQMSPSYGGIRAASVEGGVQAGDGALEEPSYGGILEPLCLLRGHQEPTLNTLGGGRDIPQQKPHSDPEAMSAGAAAEAAAGASAADERTCTGVCVRGSCIERECVLLLLLRAEPAVDCGPALCCAAQQGHARLAALLLRHMLPSGLAGVGVEDSRCLADGSAASSPLGAALCGAAQQVRVFACVIVRVCALVCKCVCVCCLLSVGCGSVWRGTAGAWVCLHVCGCVCGGGSVLPPLCWVRLCVARLSRCVCLLA